MFDTHHTVPELPYDVLCIGGRGHIVYPDYGMAEKAYAKYHSIKTEEVDYKILAKPSGYIVALIDHGDAVCMYM